MQYFGYTHAQPTPPGFQATQGQQATVSMQPEDTLVVWTYPNCYSAAALAHGGQPNLHSIDLHAESAFLGAVISANFSLSFTDVDGGHHSGTATDRTNDYVVTKGPTQGTKRINKVSGHMPHQAIFYSSVPYTPSGLEAGQPWCGSALRYKLLDTFGQPCPGVWVQERFTTSPLPPNFMTNQLAGTFWTTNIYGVFGTDNIFYKWAAVSPGGELPEPYVLVHHYWAATQDFLAGGIDLGPFTMTLRPGFPGTATHTP